MKTIGELFELSHRMEHAVALFGAPEEFLREYRRRLRSVGEAMIKDYKRTVDQILSMPHNAPLGARAQERLEDLELWLRENWLEQPRA